MTESIEVIESTQPAAEAPKQKRASVSDAVFVTEYGKAVAARESTATLASRLGVSVQSVLNRRKGLESDGMKLPHLSRAKNRDINSLRRLYREAGGIE